MEKQSERREGNWGSGAQGEGKAGMLGLVSPCPQRKFSEVTATPSPPPANPSPQSCSAPAPPRPSSLWSLLSQELGLSRPGSGWARGVPGGPGASAACDQTSGRVIGKKKGSRPPPASSPSPGAASLRSY